MSMRGFMVRLLREYRRLVDNGARSSAVARRRWHQALRWARREVKRRRQARARWRRARIWMMGLAAMGVWSRIRAGVGRPRRRAAGKLGGYREAAAARVAQRADGDTVRSRRRARRPWAPIGLVMLWKLQGRVAMHGRTPWESPPPRPHTGDG